MIEGVVAVFVAKVPLEGLVGGAGRGASLRGVVERADGEVLPCRTEAADLWFAEYPEQLGRARRLCRVCPVRQQCLAGALRRREPWGVWGGEIFQRGKVTPFKRGRGRPAKARPGRAPGETSAARAC